MNTIRIKIDCSEPPYWTSVSWDMEYDITTLLHNIAVAGALTKAWQMGQENGVLWWTGKVVRKDSP